MAQRILTHSVGALRRRNFCTFQHSSQNTASSVNPLPWHFPTLRRLTSRAENDTFSKTRLQ